MTLTLGVSTMLICLKEPASALIWGRNGATWSKKSPARQNLNLWNLWNVVAPNLVIVRFVASPNLSSNSPIWESWEIKVHKLGMLEGRQMRTL